MSGNLVANEALFKLLLDHLHEGVYFTDPQRKILYWNHGAECITGYSADDVVGHCCFENILEHTDFQGHALCTGSCPLAATMEDCEARQARVYLKHKEGHRVPVRVTTARIVDEEGVLLGGLETFHDITSELAAFQAVEELKDQALMCPLTGAGNRRYTAMMMHTRFDEMVGLSTPSAVLFVDVDHFKQFNDRYGHSVGDVILKMVGKTLANAVRNCDFVGRWGGEEFVILAKLTTQEELAMLAERVINLVSKSSQDISQGRLSVTVSLGATLAQPGEDENAVLGRADALMYESKKAGRNRYTIG